MTSEYQNLLFSPFWIQWFSSGKTISREGIWSHASRGRHLTQTASRVILRSVESREIKVVGQLHQTPWQRFARLQRTAAKLARGRGQPKGVYKFASNEACDSWTANLNRNGK